MISPGNHHHRGLRGNGLTGEVTTLEHKVGDDTVERRALVAKAVLSRRKCAEVGGGLRDNIVVCKKHASGIESNRRMGVEEKPKEGGSKVMTHKA